MESTLTIFARPSLDRSIRAYNELMIIAPSGAFADVDGARIAPDGYLEFDCEFCQDGPIAATMVEWRTATKGEIAAYSHRPGEAIVRSLTPGAHVAIGELVLCAQCNVRNRIGRGSAPLLEAAG